MAPYGYEKSEKVEFVIKDTGEIQKVIMYDQPIIQAIKTGDSSKFELFYNAWCFEWNLYFFM